MKAWLARAGGKACPVCRVPINVDQLQRFSIDNKPGEPPQAPPKLMSNSEAVPRSRREIQYNFINSQIMQDIQAMESYGSYGSKIETLIRHLLYLDVVDPGTKSIVFSAWADSLMSERRLSYSEPSPWRLTLSRSQSFSTRSGPTVCERHHGSVLVGGLTRGLRYLVSPDRPAHW